MNLLLHRVFFPELKESENQCTNLQDLPFKCSICRWNLITIGLVRCQLSFEHTHTDLKWLTWASPQTFENHDGIWKYPPKNWNLVQEPFNWGPETPKENKTATYLQEYADYGPANKNEEEAKKKGCRTLVICSVGKKIPRRTPTE